MRHIVPHAVLMTAIVGPAFFLAQSLLLVSPVSAQIATGRCGPASPYNKAYDARGYYYNALVQPCEKIIVDATQGAQAAQPGQFLFFVQGRFDHNEPGAFMRAIPNRAYPVGDDETIWAFDATPPTALANVPVVPPFVPTKTVYLGQGAYGMYGLVMLNRGASAAPLNENSVIIGIAGYGFNSPRALQAMLSYLTPTYLPVLYFQLNERSPVMRRTFVRFMPRADAQGIWESTVRSRPLQGPSSGNNPAMAWAGIALGLGVIAAFTNSSLGQNFIRDYQACLARQQATIC